MTEKERAIVIANRLLDEPGADPDSDLLLLSRQLLRALEEPIPPPEVSTQMLIDAGLNAFGLELFVESIAGKKDFKNFNPISCRYKGVKLTFEPDPSTWRDPLGNKLDAPKEAKP